MPLTTTLRGRRITSPHFTKHRSQTTELAISRAAFKPSTHGSESVVLTPVSRTGSKGRSLPCWGGDSDSHSHTPGDDRARTHQILSDRIESNFLHGLAGGRRGQEKRLLERDFADLWVRGRAAWVPADHTSRPELCCLPALSAKCLWLTQPHFFLCNLSPYP